MTATRNGYERGRARARWSVADLAAVVEAVLGRAPERLWSADDLRARLAFGVEGAGPAASSVREALRALEREGRAERVEVWGRRGWGNTAVAWRAPGREGRQLTLAA